MLFLKLLFICYFPNVHFYLPVRSFFFFYLCFCFLCMVAMTSGSVDATFSCSFVTKGFQSRLPFFFIPILTQPPWDVFPPRMKPFMFLIKQFFFIIILMIVPFYFVLFFLSYSLYCSWFGKFKKASDDAIKKVLHLHLVWSSRFITNCMCLKTKKQYLVLAPMHLNTSRLNIQYNIFTEDGAVRLKSINNNFSLIVV